ncbi:MAG: FAD-dependent oxidoreductase [Candidatus Woesebacteria bacterium]|nr:MAG: FAD-dependent oxidoreductase [Candidatus Woesebacteria bacterium]
MKYSKNYDIAIIGAGFYGCALALFFANKNLKVALLEKEKDLLERASYKNQARIHNGYHYPRHFITALRSHLNYEKFIKDFDSAVYKDFKQYYAIAKISSKTNARQFLKFCEHVGSFIKPASQVIKNYFNNRLVEDVFEVEERVFDAGNMRKILKKELFKKVKVFYDCEVAKIERHKDKIILLTKNSKTFTATQVYNCTYSQINKILSQSGLNILPFKHEYIEMPLVKVPDEFSKIAVTILDGPFFGFLPFPDTKNHSLWHVRYSIHTNWTDPQEDNLEDKLLDYSNKSNYQFMYKDAKRYIPILKDMKFEQSLFETKTVLLDKEENDGRPILYKKNYEIPGFHVVMGGKIDNIYDIIYEIEH